MKTFLLDNPVMTGIIRRCFFHYTHIPRKFFIAALILFNSSVFMSPVWGQTVVDSILRPGLTPAGMAVYENSDKLCVFDDYSNHLLIYDGSSFSLMKEIAFSKPVFDPFSFGGMAVDEERGKLIVLVGTGVWLDKGAMIAVIDLNSDSLVAGITIPGLLPQSMSGFIFDQEDNKIYVAGQIADMNSYSVSENDLFADGLFNPVTHEVFSTNKNTGKFNFINLRSKQVTEVDAVENIFGRAVNWLENKYYLIAFPYHIRIYDRDDGSVKIVENENDAEQLIFNPGSNLMYTDAQWGCMTTILEGSSNRFFNLPMQSATHTIGFRHSTKHAYFVRFNFIGVYDENSQMFEKIEFGNPTGNDQVIAVNQSTGRIYVSNVNFNDPPGGCNPIWILQDSETMSRPNIILHDISVGKYEILDPESYKAVEFWSGNYPQKPAQGIAFRPDGGRVYCVTHSGWNSSGELEVHAGSGAWDNIGISIGNFNARVGSLSLDSQLPKSIVSSPDGTRVYITCSATNTVKTVDVSVDSSLVVTAGTITGTSPWGCAITPDGMQLYVANKGSNNLSVINTATNSVTDVIPVGEEPWGVAINPAGTQAVVTNSGSNSISVIDLPSNSIIKTMMVDSFPCWLTYSPDGKSVFVSNNGQGTVSVIDAGTLAVTRSVQVGSNPLGICCYPDGSRVIVAADSTAYIINTADFSVRPIHNNTVFRGKKNVVAVANATSRIAGRILNGNHQPVANATVKAFQNGILKGNATTNSLGDYCIFNLKDGSYDMMVSAPDYVSREMTSQAVGRGRIKTCHFNLVPLIPSAPMLVSPADAEILVTTENNLFWSNASVAYCFQLQVSADSLFQVLVYNDSTVTDTTIQVNHLTPATQYYWRVRAINESGSSPWSGFRSFVTANSAGLNDLPDDNLIQVFPNPSREKIYIVFSQPLREDAEIKLYDASGSLKLSKRLISSKSQTDISALSPGNYILEISTGPALHCKKLIVL